MTHWLIFHQVHLLVHGDSTTEYAFLSFFGRGEYNLDGKYYADFSVRADASSRFGKDNRWAGFWSVGLMWDFKKEEFFEGYDWLTNAQLTFSTGTSGNSSISNYEHLALVTGSSNYLGETGIKPHSVEMRILLGKSFGLLT